MIRDKVLSTASRSTPLAYTAMSRRIEPSKGLQRRGSLSVKGTLLVVDDESESLRLLTTILTEAGYHVRPADSGSLALASVASDPPDLILLDMRMPEMDGFEVCRRLKAKEDTREIPLMFISAASETEDLVEGFALGAVDFVSKPFQREELLARVKTHLDLSRLRGQLEKQVAERTAELNAASERLLVELAEHRRTEQGLRESEERFRIMADTAPVMIVVCGPDKLATFFNKVWLTYTGRAVEHELGQRWLEVLHPDDRETCLASYSASFEARRNWHLEFRLLRADGEYRWIHCDGVPRLAPDGGFAGYIGSAVDITDLKRAQEHAAGVQKLESLGVLASGIAHDFNNLLGGILANSELALSELAPDAPARDEVQRIRAISIHASEIVGELMTYAGQGDSVVQPLDLSNIVEEMLDLLKVSISKHATLMTDFGKNLCAVKGDPAQIRQIVMNLVINASEALHETGGVISITTLHRSIAGDLPLNKSTLKPGDYIQLEVSDTGCGMTEATRAKVFDPFFTTKSAGRGLGLAVVGGIVRAHGGEINVASTPGAGTRFQILLPCSDQPIPEGRVETTPGESVPPQTGTVLVVEDESALRLVVSKMLRKRGFNVIEAEDGYAAMDLFRKHADIHVVLLDMTLPGISGVDVLTELRKMRPDVKVILTSAYTQTTVAAFLGDQPVAAFIRKPYRIAELLSVLQDALS